MQVPTHPLLALVESNKNGLKSLLTHYIDATVDSQFASLRNSIETMIQSGMIGPQQSCDVTAFGMTLPSPTQANTDQSSAKCLHEYSNDTLNRAQEHKINLQNEVSLANTINTESTIKQEIDDEEEDGEEIDDDSVAKCEKCENGICNSVRDNYDNASGDHLETGENGDQHFETKLNLNATLENNKTTQLINSNDISPSPTNPINTEPLIKQESLQGSSITSIPLDLNINAALNYMSIDKQIEGQNTQTDEFDDNDDLDDDYYEDGEDEYLNQANCANEVCNLDHENNDNNHLDDDLTDRDGDKTELDVNLDEAQFQIDISVTNNTQMKIQNDEGNVINNELSTPSTSGVRLSTRKRVQTKVFGDLVKSNANPRNSGKRKSVQVNKSVKKTKRKQIIDDDEDTDSGNNAIGEESIATVCIVNPIPPNLAQSNHQFQCSHCHKSFDCNYNLKIHLRVHTGERPFQCDQCDKRFNLMGNLTKHQLIHQNIKNFRCDQCDKQFTQKCNLDSHQLTHSGERPFKCRHCARSFTLLGNRNNHEQAIHLHVKPYRCKQCGHTATKRSDVIRHIRAVHFGLPPTIKQQRALNIVDERDPKELVEKV